MTDNVDISDLTLKQLLHFYQEGAALGGKQSSMQGGQSTNKMSDQQDVQKFSEIMDGSSDVQGKVDQNLANIVDDLIKTIGNKS